MLSSNNVSSKKKKVFAEYSSPKLTGDFWAWLLASACENQHACIKSMETLSRVLSDARRIPIKATSVASRSYLAGAPPLTVFLSQDCTKNFGGGLEFFLSWIELYPTEKKYVPEA